MNTQEGFQQCYNAQSAVDAASQVIVACDLGTNAKRIRAYLAKLADA